MLKPWMLVTSVLFAAPAAVAEEAPVAPPVAAATQPAFSYQLFGFIRLKGAVVQNDPAVAFVGRNDGFLLQNARVGVAGSWGTRLRFRLSADGAVDERQGANDTEGTLRFALKDAFADVVAEPRLVLRVARFAPVFDLEDLTAETERLFVDRSVESRGVPATLGFETPGLAPGRSLGVALRSDRVAGNDRVALGYEVAAMNGNGEYASAADNDSVALSGALFVRFGEGSFVLLAARSKQRSEGELPFRQTERDLAGAFGCGLRVWRLSFAAQVIAERTTFATTGGPAENSLGGHAQLAYRQPLGAWGWIEGAGRWAVYEPSDLIETDLVQEQTVGLNLRVLSLPIRLQLDYTHAVEQAGRRLENDRFEAVFEVSL